MNNFQTKTWNRLIINKSPVVAELPSTSNKSRRWMCIYPNLFKSVNINVPEHEFSILEFEINVDDMQKYEGDEDLVMFNKKRIYVSDCEALHLALVQLKVDPSLFDTPWKYDYPL